MAKQVTAVRTPPLAGRHFANGHVSLEPAKPAARISLRATGRGATTYSKILGMDLPSEPSQVSAKGGRMAVWLGPDEWLIIDEKQVVSGLMPKRGSKEISAVDISHRNTAIVVSGDAATNLLNEACPRDLSLDSFPVGTGSRTILGKAEIILLRTGRTDFRIECWRSFSDYVWDLLSEAAKDAHL
ncbi:MAG: sarcosine oxidase subunit gamma [Rhizobiaceae bacterium]